MDSTFVKLTAGTRITNYIGLKMDQGKEFRFGKNYLYLDVPLATMEDMEVKRNQHIFIEAGGTINVKGRDIVEVEPNPALAEYGQVQGSYKVHPDSGEKRLGVWFTAHKQVDLSQFEYLVRLYMYG